MFAHIHIKERMMVNDNYYYIEWFNYLQKLYTLYAPDNTQQNGS